MGGANALGHAQHTPAEEEDDNRPEQRLRRLEATQLVRSRHDRQDVVDAVVTPCSNHELDEEAPAERTVSMNPSESCKRVRGQTKAKSEHEGACRTCGRPDPKQGDGRRSADAKRRYRAGELQGQPQSVRSSGHRRAAPSEADIAHHVLPKKEWQRHGQNEQLSTPVRGNEGSNKGE